METINLPKMKGFIECVSKHIIHKEVCILPKANVVIFYLIRFYYLESPSILLKTYDYV